MAIDLNTYFDKISKLRMIQRILIFAGTVVLIVGLYIWLVYIPKTGEIKTIKSELDRLETNIRIARVRASNLKRLEADLAKAQGDLKVAIKLLPTTSEIPSLLKNITKLGNDSNLEFLLFSPEKQVSKEFYVEIPVSIEVLGSYHDVAIFFDKVGKLDRIVNVVNVNMIPIKELSTTLKTSCKATTYRFKEGKKTESVPKKKK
ncbi:MAG TPA: type 4a pilus biogenesis protein PilO [Desulfatiglandales bacterium]|nr:type 4a pilus biogenesis protein PilO [Desulfatiglandales bacterium]